MGTPFSAGGLVVAVPSAVLRGVRRGLEAWTQICGEECFNRIVMCAMQVGGGWYSLHGVYLTSQTKLKPREIVTCLCV